MLDKWLVCFHWASLTLTLTLLRCEFHSGLPFLGFICLFFRCFAIVLSSCAYECSLNASLHPGWVTYLDFTPETRSLRVRVRVNLIIICNPKQTPRGLTLTQLRYDVALWATISDYPYSWPLWQRYASKFVVTNMVRGYWVRVRGDERSKQLFEPIAG